MSGFRQREIPGLREAVSPLKIKDLRFEPPRALDRGIGAAGIRNDDFINYGSDTLQSAFDPILFILNDHA